MVCMNGKVVLSRGLIHYLAGNHAKKMTWQAGGPRLRVLCLRHAIDLLAVEEPKPKPANSYDTAIRAVSYEAAKLFKRMRSASSAPNPTSGQYSQGPGTQRKTSPATATWQTDGNDR